MSGDWCYRLLYRKVYVQGCDAGSCGAMHMARATIGLGVASLLTTTLSLKIHLHSTQIIKLWSKKPQ